MLTRFLRCVAFRKGTLRQFIQRGCTGCGRNAFRATENFKVGFKTKDFYAQNSVSGE